MIENFTTVFQEFTRNVRFVDFLDIALISVFLYLLLRWLRQSVSNRSLLGLTVLIGVYVFARITDMYLTELLIQGLFVVILIGVVVVFQSDIRRVIDRIGNWRILNNHDYSYSNETTDILTEAITAMAKQKMGGLIVLKGNEALDRHIHGGIKLDGEISLPLLHSIFNPRSPGHDGAVIMEGSNIVRFGTHLPLSVNLDRKSAGGTRHAAALGISEHSDALVIVVSEERGTISIAQSGRLSEIESGQELKSILTNFWNQHYQLSETTWLDWWKQRDLLTAVASLLLAGVLWFSFAYQPTAVYRTFAVPIEYRNLQENNIILQDSIPMEARVTLSGSEQAFRSLDASDLAISFDMSAENVHQTEELLVTQNNINLPADISLYDVSPQTLQIKARQLAEIQRPVYVPTNGSLPEDRELVNLDWEPREVEILADTTDREVPDSVSVEPLDLSAFSESDTVSQSLAIPPGMKVTDERYNEISVIIEVQQKEPKPNPNP